MVYIGSLPKGNLTFPKHSTLLRIDNLPIPKDYILGYIYGASGYYRYILRHLLAILGYFHSILEYGKKKEGYDGHIPLAFLFHSE